MKMNKERLEGLAKKNDSELWAEIVKIAGSHGINFGDKMPTHDELERIRRAMLGIEKINIGDAKKIISEYKKKG